MEERMRSRDVSTIPEVLRLAEEVDASQAPLMLTVGERIVAVMTPVGVQAEHPDDQAGQTRRRSDTLLNIIGIGESAEPSDVEHHKHEYLAEAYEARHE